MPSREEKPFVIAIIGGGIGGLFAALSLHHHGTTYGNIEIHVYEQAAQYKEIGAGIGIGVNAARLLHKLGLGEATNNIAGDRNGVWISFRRWDNGEDIVTVPVDDKKLIRQLPVQRSEFLNLLVDAVKERAAATLHTNKRCRRLIVSVSALQPQSILNLLVDYFAGARRRSPHRIRRRYKCRSKPCGWM
jgi:salicylate hydroxylase